MRRDDLRVGEPRQGDLLRVSVVGATAATPVPVGWTLAMALAWSAFVGGPLAAAVLALRAKVTGRSRSVA